MPLLWLRISRCVAQGCRVIRWGCRPSDLKSSLTSDGSMMFTLLRVPSFSLLQSHRETERIFGKHTNILKNVLSFKLPSTCRWVRACWRSSPCACEAAGSDFLSRISAGWAIHSSQCEGSPQNSASLSLLFSRLLAFHASQSLLQSHKDPFEVQHQKTHFWTHKNPSLWYPQSLVWTCWLWSEWAVPGGLRVVTLLVWCRLCRAHSFPPPTLKFTLEWDFVLTGVWWFINLSIRVQEKHNRARISGWLHKKQIMGQCSFPKCVLLQVQSQQISYKQTD